MQEMLKQRRKRMLCISYGLIIILMEYIENIIIDPICCIDNIFFFEIL